MANKPIITGLMFLYFISSLSAQRGRPYVSNLDLNIEGDQVVVGYDLCNTTSDRPYKIDLLMIDDRFNLIEPDSVYADTGPEVYGGKDKKIIWDVRKDPRMLRGNYKPGIVIDGVWENGGSGGASNAFLSVLFPGLGDYFVSNTSKRKIKPWYVSFASAGLIGLSFVAGNNRGKEIIHSSYVYEHWDWNSAAHQWTYVNEVREFTYEGGTKYWLFPYDQEIFLGLGAAIWISDIIYVWAKGGQNTKIRKSKLLKSNNLHTSAFADPRGIGMKISVGL